MDTTSDITSTCENDKIKKAIEKSSEVFRVDHVDRYNCEIETEDSENETIDVIYESSDIVPNNNDRLRNIRPIDVPTNSDRIYFYEQNVQNITSKPVNDISSDYLHDDSRSTKHCINNSKSKTFLIDNILGNTKEINKSQNKILNDETDNFEETTDEHNGKFLNLNIFWYGTY